MHLLRIRPVAHALHTMNSDYELKVPEKFRHVGLLGIIVVIASAIWTAANPSSYGVIGIVVGIILTLPVVITYVVTRSLFTRRFQLRDGIVEHAALRGDEMVLDVGVGSGITLFGLAKKLTTGKGVGIDIYDPNSGGGTPEIFWKNARAEGLADKVDLKNMDARKMSFGNETFDVVVSTFAFHHVGDAAERRQASQEIVRVLKPGGKVFVYDAALALKELEQVMREAGFDVHQHGDRLSMVMGVKSV